MSPATTKSRVVICHASVGAGHRRAAEAIAAALRRGSSPIDAEIIDTLDWTPRWFRCVYGGGYAWLVRRYPWLFGFLYFLTNHPPRWYNRPFARIQQRFDAFMVRALARELADRQPVYLVSTHYLLGGCVATVFADRLSEVRHVVVVTDHEAHRFWKIAGAERYFVASEKAAGDLIGMGVDKSALTISGIPVHPIWHEKCDESAVMKAWGLSRDRPVVLMVGGASFTMGPFADLVRMVLDANPEVQVVAVTGRDRAVYDAVRWLAESRSMLTAVQFTDKLHELASVATLMVTKPGGLITSEALAKAVPMVLVNPIPGQETANARHLVKHGAAVLCPSSHELPDLIRELLKDSQRLSDMRRAAESLSKTAASAIADFIAEWIPGKQDA